jgi:hypothetical protein
LLYTSGIIRFTILSPAPLVDEARHQVGKLQEIGNPDQPATPANDDLRSGATTSVHCRGTEQT